VKTHPWQAAMNDLQEIYIYGALFAALCLSIVLYTLYQTYKKQEKLEETRRDFTNAVAHELKTPLTIVRGLVENMEEEESEEQKASYRKELVNQTEVMDDLVKEMIFISKLDSDKIILKEDQISVFSIIEDQMKKLEHPIEEKNLLVQYWKEDDFIIKGDKSYLEKAMFNLLENAVSHNKPNGKISISLEKDKCMIENTADAIEEENLPHICELFFTGDKSRNSDENHKGLGLYLAKKIFDLHGIELKIENMDIGVKVTIS
jgi:signal transduction histidine kinase